MPTMKTHSALVSELNKCITVAVENVSYKMVNQLRYYLKEDYYRMYHPNKYTRTFQLQNAPTYEMLSKNMSKIFIDTESMNYREASGDYVANIASLGFHGNSSIFRPGFYWADFIEWANGSVPKMLKDELKKQGLTIK